MLKLTNEDFAKKISLTKFQPDVTYEDLEELCETAKVNNFKTVIVNSGYVKFCADLLEDSGVLVGGEVGFPFGQTSIPTKSFEAEDAFSNGAKEIDYVINITELKAGHDDYIEAEMKLVWDICQTHDLICKVILEMFYLTAEEIQRVVKIALKLGINFVKTSTGFGPEKITAKDIRFLETITDNQIKIEAAVGISSYDECVKLIEAGADRVCIADGVQFIY